MLYKVGEILDVERRQRQPVGDAAGGDPRVVDWRGRPRCVAAADNSPHMAAMLLPPGITGLSASQSSSIARLRGPQRRSLVHWVSSPTVTKVTSGCRPTSRAANPAGSRPVKDLDATSVS
jgi:hypothetical protein